MNPGLKKTFRGFLCINVPEKLFSNFFFSLNSHFRQIIQNSVNYYFYRQYRFWVFCSGGLSSTILLTCTKSKYKH